MADGPWLVGLAEYLDEEGVGVWLTTGSYQTGQCGIVIGALPPAPVSVIGLIPYVVGDEHGQPWGERAVQITMRSQGIIAALELQDAVFKALDHRSLRLGGVDVPMVWRQVADVVAPDESKREIIQDSYYLRVSRT